MTLTINDKFRDLLDLPSEAERKELEAQLLANGGPRDPIVVWKEKQQIVDGHNRYAICLAHNLKFEKVEMSFKDEGAVEEWIIANQLARRNMTPQRMTYFIGKLYNMRKQDKSQGPVPTPEGKPTAQVLAEQFGVNEKTVRRAGDFANGADVVSEVIGLKSVKDRLAVLSNKSEVSFTKQEVEELGKVKDKEVAKEAVKIMVEEKKEAAKAKPAPKPAAKAEGKPAKAKSYAVAFCKPDFDRIGFSVTTEERPAMADNCMVYMSVPDEELHKGMDLMKRWGLTFEGSFVFKIDGYEGNWTDVVHTFMLMGSRGTVVAPKKSSKSLQTASGNPELDMIKLIEAYHPKTDKVDMRKKVTAEGWDKPAK